jgi:hypothetical protein
MAVLAAALFLGALLPASAGARASAWKLVSVRGETHIHVEDRRVPSAAEGCEETWVASGDYRSTYSSRTAIFGRGYGVYNGIFGTIVGTFQLDFRISRQGSERVLVSETVSDPETGDESCRMREERNCQGSSEKRSRGTAGLGFSPQRRRGRLGPVRVGFSGHWNFHSCDRRAPDPLDFLQLPENRQDNGLMPRPFKVLPLSAFRPRRMRIVMKGSAPLIDRSGEGDVDASVDWRFVWILRRTVVGHEGCIEQGPRSGFVCQPSP